MNSFNFFYKKFKKNIVIHNGFKIDNNNHDSTFEDIFCLGMAARYDNFKDHKTFINALEICNKKKYQIFIVLSWERNKLS